MVPKYIKENAAGTCDKEVEEETGDECEEELDN